MGFHASPKYMCAVMNARVGREFFSAMFDEKVTPPPGFHDHYNYYLHGFDGGGGPRATFDEFKANRWFLT